MSNMIVSFLKFNHPAKRQHKLPDGKNYKDRIYKEEWFYEILKDRKDRKLNNIIVLEQPQTEEQLPKIVGEVLSFYMQGEWAFADILFTDNKAEALVRTGKRLVRPMMIGEFDEGGDIMGIREIRYLYLTLPEDCSWPGEKEEYGHVASKI
jgi:hypothetical protein